MFKKYSLIGLDGNALSVMGYVSNAMKECGKTKEDIDSYTIKAISGNYNDLLKLSQAVLDDLNI